MSALHSSYFNNTVEYVTPSPHGLSAAVWHSTQFEGETNNLHNASPITNYKGGSASGVGIRYAKGAWLVSADSIDIDADTVASANMSNGSGWQIGTRYEAGAFSFAALYEDVENLGLGTNAYLNGIYKTGNTRLIATLGQNRDATQFSKLDIDTWSLGAKYALTKKSELFAAYNSRDEGTKEYNTTTVGLNVKFGY